MSKATFEVATFTPAAQADGATLTTLTYMALQGASGTQLLKIEEVWNGGGAPSTSSPMFMLLAHDSVVGVTPTALVTPNSNGFLPASAGNPTAVGFITAGTNPTRANTITLPKLALIYNAFGGVARWTATRDDSRYEILGNTQPLGEASLSGFTGTTATPVGGHWIYEQV